MDDGKQIPHHKKGKHYKQCPIDKICVASLTLLLGLVLTVPALAQDYDLVINNGRVMDPETMYDDIANVGIKDGRIAAITKDKISGKETIVVKESKVLPVKAESIVDPDKNFVVMIMKDGKIYKNSVK